jgi:hypothetical protein
VADAEKVIFEGVIAGFESPEGYSEPSLYIQGSVNGEPVGFYLLIPKERHEELSRLGVGQMISGKGVIVSRDPLIIRLLEES